MILGDSPLSPLEMTPPSRSAGLTRVVRVDGAHEMHAIIGIRHENGVSCETVKHIGLLSELDLREGVALLIEEPLALLLVAAAAEDTKRLRMQC